MATKKVNIDLVAKDKTRQAMQSATKGVDGVKNSVLNLKNALIGLGAGVAIKGFVDVGKSVESLQVRLKFLFGSVEEGAKAFDAMAKFAGKVPFSLGEIQSGAGVLAVVSKDANELSKILELTGNVAAVTGLDFRTAAEQIQRSFSAGIGAADLFREKGVRNMLGFKAGATVSIEDTVKAFEKVFGQGGRFGKATDELAQTFTGTLSMIGDKIFSFKKTILEAGLFESLKKEFGALDKFLEENAKQIDSIAQDIGIALGFAVKGVAKFVIILKDNMDKFAIVIKGLIAIKVVSLFISLGKAIGFAAKQMAKFSLASLLSVKGLKGLAALLAKGGAVFVAFKGIDKLFEDLEKNFEEFSSSIKNALPDTRDFHKIHKGIVKEKEKVVQLTAREKALIQNSKQQLEGFDHILRRMVGKELKQFENMIANIEILVVQGILDGIKKVSRSLAEAVILGKNLTESFKAMAQQLLVNILAGLIEQLALMSIQKLLGKDQVDQEAEKDNLIRKQNTNLKRQIALQTILAAFGGGGGGSSLKFFASGGAVTKGQPTIVGERGAEMFIPNSSGQITQAARGTAGGSVNVNFNINTIDSRGFDQALVENRGTITSIINNALTEKGRGELV